MVFADYLRSQFSVSQPKALRSRANDHLSELRRSKCSQESHLFFCSPFSPTEFLVTVSNLFFFTATGPDKVAYSMLKHRARSGTDFLLHIFNLSCTLRSFPSIWKTSSVVPTHKMRKHLDSPAFFRPISPTSCVLKLFERIILSRLLFFLESNSIFSSHQASFRPGRSTLDQILYLSLSISDGFNKPRRGSKTILSIIDFSKAFDSIWHLVLFQKLIMTGLPHAFLVGLNLFFLIGALAWFIKITKTVSCKSVEVFQKDLFLALFFSLSSSIIFRLLCLLPSAVLFTLAIWLFGPSTLRSQLRWRLHKELYFNWSAGLSAGVFLSIRKNVRPPSSQWIPIKLTSSPTSSYSTPASVSIPLQFLGVTFDRNLFFSKHVSLLKAKFFPRLKALRCIPASSWGPSKESLSLLYKAFLRPLLTYASPRWFPLLSVAKYG